MLGLSVIQLAGLEGVMNLHLKLASLEEDKLASGVTVLGIVWAVGAFKLGIVVCLWTATDTIAHCIPMVVALKLGIVVCLWTTTTWTAAHSTVCLLCQPGISQSDSPRISCVANFFSLDLLATVNSPWHVYLHPFLVLFCVAKFFSHWK